MTLVEVVAAMAVSAIIMSSASAVIYSMTHTGTALGVVADQRNTASLAMLRLRREFRLAKTVSILTDHDVEFTHPDMNGDTLDETIRYTWSGASGDPFTRTLNGGAAQVLVENCNDLSFQIDIDAVVDSSNILSDTGEILIASHDTFLGGLLHITASGAISTTRHQAETFTPTYPDAVSFRITRVYAAMAKTASSVTGNVLMSVRPAKSGTNDPSTTIIEEVTRSANSLQTTTTWEPFDFSNCTGLIPGQKYCIVARGSVASTSARWEVQQLTVSIVDNGVIYRSSSNAGSTWGPTTGLDVNDLRFSVYGAFQLSTPNPDPSIASGSLETVYVSLESREGDSVVSLEGGVECVNRPDLTGFKINALPVLP